MCLILGLATVGGTYQHTKALGEDERRTITRKDVPKDRAHGGHLFACREPSLGAVSESGLYKLIMRSDKAAARPFQDWVTKDVLPSIRKTGGSQVDVTES